MKTVYRTQSATVFGILKVLCLITVNIICEGLLLILFLEKYTHINCKASLVQKPYPISDQNGQNQLRSIPYLWPKPYIAHIRKYPLPRGGGGMLGERTFWNLPDEKRATMKRNTLRPFPPNLPKPRKPGYKYPGSDDRVYILMHEAVLFLVILFSYLSFPFSRSYNNLSKLLYLREFLIWWLSDAQVVIKR